MFEKMKIALLIYLVIVSVNIYSITTFTYRTPESENDKRFYYYNELLKLALDKTTQSDGEYILKPSPVMNYSRVREYLDSGKLENFIVVYSATNERCDSLNYINFPVELGILGYRVFFVADKAWDRFQNVKTVDDLKKFEIIQGTGWADNEIFRHAGIEIREIAKYDHLFIDISKNNSDLFPRGINEILPEYESFKYLGNLRYNTDVILYYPYLRFFYTSKGNEKAMERVQRGLLIAYNDGSFLELWNKYYFESIDTIKVKNSTIIRIDNPTISNIDKSYEKYLLNLEK